MNHFTKMIGRTTNTLMNIYNNQEKSFSDLYNILKLKKVNNVFVYQPKIIINILNSELNESIFL